MHGIYALEEMLCDELEKIGEKNELTAGSLDNADKLSHALKNVQKIIEYYEDMGEDGYSRDGERRMDDGRYWTARGSYARGRGAKRDSRGRYSNRYSMAEGMDEMKKELRTMMETAPNAHVKQRMQELISELDMM